MESKLKKCSFCRIYTLKKKCEKCRKETSSAHYKFLHLKDAPSKFKTDKLLQKLN